MCQITFSYWSQIRIVCYMCKLLLQNGHTKPVSYLKWGSFVPLWEFMQLQWTNLCPGWYKRSLNQLLSDFCVNDDPKYGTWSYVCNQQSRHRSFSKDPRKSSKNGKTKWVTYVREMLRGFSLKKKSRMKILVLYFFLWSLCQWKRTSIWETLPFLFWFL